MQKGGERRGVCAVSVHRRVTVESKWARRHDEAWVITATAGSRQVSAAWRSAATGRRSSPCGCTAGMRSCRSHWFRSSCPQGNRRALNKKPQHHPPSRHAKVSGGPACTTSPSAATARAATPPATPQHPQADLTNPGTRSLLKAPGCVPEQYYGLAGRSTHPGSVIFGDAPVMESDRVDHIVAALRARGVMAHRADEGVDEFGIRVVIPDGSEALWSLGAGGLDAQVLRDGILMGFVPHIPGSETFTDPQMVNAIASAAPYPEEGLRVARSSGAEAGAGRENTSVRAAVTDRSAVRRRGRLHWPHR